MELTSYGGAGVVTGSKHLLTSKGLNFLVDSGLFQGEGVEKKNEDVLPFKAHEIKAIFLTHAHLDHCGYLPVLVKSGFHGKIYCTKATRSLAEIILLDSAKIQEYEAKESQTKKHLLYEEEDVLRTLDFFDTCDFDKTYHCEHLTFSFHTAGHVLGAAFLRVELEGKSLTFSGDIGQPYDMLMPSPAPLIQTDYLVLESTYGDRIHSKENTINHIASELKEVIANGGTLLVPVFALARLQLFLAYLHEVFTIYPELKIAAFVDSPMGSAMTKVYKDYHYLLRPTEKEFLTYLESAKILEFSKETEKMHKMTGPKIIIASSGMISGGRIMNHVERLGKYESTTILLTGYQGKGTIGRELLEGAREIRINGHRQKIRAKVSMLESLSAHADKEQLLDWVQTASKNPHKIFLVHGEPESLAPFKEFLSSNLESLVEINAEGKSQSL